MVECQSIAASAGQVGLYEPLYRPDQVSSSDLLIPLEMRDNSRPDWREFAILVSMYKQGIHQRHAATGLISPKFGLKSRVGLESFVAFVHAHTGDEVSFVNPFPQLAYWSYNVWMQGEHAHPGLGAAAQALLDKVGIGWRLSSVPRHGQATLAYCNFWAGSPEFWERYVGGVLVPIAEFLEDAPDDPVAQAVMRDTTHTDPAPLLPFIIERLFSTFLSLHPECNASAMPIEFDDALAHCVDEFERVIVRYMRYPIEIADASGKPFDGDLLRQMDAICALWQQHFFDLYSLVPHPHTGRKI